MAGKTRLLASLYNSFNGNVARQVARFFAGFQHNSSVSRQISPGLLRRLNLSFLGVVIDVMVTSKNQETKANDKMNRKIRDQNEKFFLFIKWGKNYEYNVFRLNTLQKSAYNDIGTPKIHALVPVNIFPYLFIIPILFFVYILLWPS